MNNLLFTALIIALLYYFFYYLPKKQLVSNPHPTKLTHSQFTQTNPILKNPTDETTIDCPGAIIIPDPNIIKKLQEDIQQKNQTIIGLNNSYDQLEKKKKQEIESLQSQIRDLAKRPVKPTNSKGTQTDDKSLENTLDNLIKDIQALNNEL